MSAFICKNQYFLTKIVPSGIRLCDGCKLAMNRKKDVTIFRHDVTINFFFFFDVAVFFLLGLVTGPSFMSISWLVWSYDNSCFIRDWPEFQKSEIPQSEFYRISRGWLGIPNFKRMSLTKCYWMLQNSKVTVFTISELWRENQREGGLPPDHDFCDGAVNYILIERSNKFSLR